MPRSLCLIYSSSACWYLYNKLNKGIAVGASNADREEETWKCLKLLSLIEQNGIKIRQYIILAMLTTSLNY